MRNFEPDSGRKEREEDLEKRGGVEGGEISHGVGLTGEMDRVD